MKKMTMTRIPKSVWDGLLCAYLSGCGLRELARASNLKESTVTAYASRNGWAALRKKARDIIVPDPAVISPEETIQNVMATHREKFQTGAARAISKAVTHAAELDPAAALESSRKLADLVGAGCKLHGLGASEATTFAVQVLNQW
ncbi:MAG: hypothetical protein WCS31_13370 [Verrucomicrobiae bacterium]